MIVNHDKFQANVVKRNYNMNDQYTPFTDSDWATSDKSVKLSSVHINHKLSFNKQVFSQHKKASDLR